MFLILYIFNNLDSIIISVQNTDVQLNKFVKIKQEYMQIILFLFIKAFGMSFSSGKK